MAELPLVEGKVIVAIPFDDLFDFLPFVMEMLDHGVQAIDLRDVGKLNGRGIPAVFHEVKIGVDKGLPFMPFALLLIEILQGDDRRLDLVDDRERAADDDAVGSPGKRELPQRARNRPRKRVLAQIGIPLLLLLRPMEFRSHLHRFLIVDAVIDIACAQQKIDELVDA